MHQWGTHFLYNQALFVACGNLLFFCKDLLYFSLMLKLLLLVTHTIFIGFSFSLLLCFVSNIVFLIWCSFIMGNCDPFMYLLLWTSINKLTQVDWVYEKNTKAERYKDHVKRLFIPVLHEKKTFGLKTSSTLKQASEFFFKILKSLSKQNPWRIRVKEFTTTFIKRNTFTDVINGVC